MKRLVTISIWFASAIPLEGLATESIRASSFESGKRVSYQFQMHSTQQSLDQVMSSQHEWHSEAWPPLYPDSHYWVKFDFTNDKNSPIELVLVDEWVLIDDIEVYLTANGKVIAWGHDSETAPMADRAYKNRFPTFKFALEPGEYTFFVRYHNTNFPSVRLSLHKLSDFTESAVRQFSMLGAIFGSLGIMAIYNFFVFLVLKERAYLFYASYVCCFIIFEGILTGFLFSIGLPKHEAWRYVMLFFANCTMIFVLLFSGAYLSIDHNSFFSRIARIMIAALAAATLLQFLNYRYGAIATIVMDFCMIIWILSVSFHLIPTRQFIVYVFALAWTILAIGDFFTASYYISLLPVSFLTHWGLLLGSVIEAALISFGLAWKVNFLRVRAAEADVSQSKLSMAKAIQELIVQSGERIDHQIMCKSLYLSAEETGGDWLFVDKSSNGRVFAVVADVTGHGIGSAIITGLLRGTVETSIQWADHQGLDLRQSAQLLANQLNLVLKRTGRHLGYLMSANIFVIDLDSNRGVFLNNGHLPAYLRIKRHSETKQLFSRGSLLGLLDLPKFHLMDFDFFPGDYLFSFTDGVIENPSKDGTCIKIRSIKKIIDSSVNIEAAFEQLQLKGEKYWYTPSLNDDVTFLLLARGDLINDKSVEILKSS